MKRSTEREVPQPKDGLSGPGSGANRLNPLQFAKHIAGAAYDLTADVHNTVMDSLAKKDDQWMSENPDAAKKIKQGSPTKW